MKSQFYENALTKQGVKFSWVEKLDLDEIDAKRSLRNQARLENPIDEELVKTYAAAIRDGDQFPPLVVWKTGKGGGRCVLIDGNQRLAALLKVGRKRHDAYVVECSDEAVIDRLTWTFNNLVNGKRLSPEESLQHAITFVRKYGMSQQEAASLWGVPLGRVRYQTRIEDVRDVLNRQNVKSASIMKPSLLDNLATLIPAGEDVVAKAAKVSQANGLTDKQTESLFRDVSEARTHDAKAKVLDDFEASDDAAERRAETAGGRVSSPLPRVKLAQQLRQVQRTCENYAVKSLRPAPEKEFLEVREVAAEVIDKLNEVFGLGAVRKAGAS